MRAQCRMGTAPRHAPGAGPAPSRARGVRPSARSARRALQPATMEPPHVNHAQPAPTNPPPGNPHACPARPASSPAETPRSAALCVRRVSSPTTLAVRHVCSALLAPSSLRWEPRHVTCVCPALPRPRLECLSALRATPGGSPRLRAPCPATLAPLGRCSPPTGNPAAWRALWASTSWRPRRPCALPASPAASTTSPGSWRVCLAPRGPNSPALACRRVRRAPLVGRPPSPAP